MTLAETRPQNLKLTATLSCHCGKSFSSRSAFAVHQFKRHGITPAVGRYTDASNACTSCLLQCSTRQSLIDHVQYESKLRILNIPLRVEHLSVDAETNCRENAQKLKLA